jgi:hypothetical protein
MLAEIFMLRSEAAIRKNLDAPSCSSVDEPTRRPDAGAANDIDRLVADIAAADKRFFVVLAVALPIAFALLTVPLWT